MPFDRVSPFPAAFAGEALPRAPAPVRQAATEYRRSPYTPETLGERWGCSAEKVRQMFRGGELPGFRLGKLIRIPAIEVERYECAQIEAASDTSSSHIEESLPSRSVA